jgi:hypothetical protein
LGKLALAGAGDPDHGEGAEAAEDVDGGRAAGIEKARAEGEVDAQLGQPAAAPDPMRQQRKDKWRRGRRGGAARGEAQRSAPEPQGMSDGQGDGQEFKEQRELRLGRGSAQAAEQKRDLAPSQFQGLPARWKMWPEVAASRTGSR